ncbi:MAG: hypothetical protein WBL80_03360 [Erysipelotrichaceae bacterium]
MAKSKWPQVQGNLHLVLKWARDGLLEQQIAKNLGISVSCLEKYKIEHVELKEALKNGKKVLVVEIENALIKKAKGYEYEEKKVYTKNEDGVTTTYTEITKKHQPPDTAAAIFILKNKDSENYIDNPQMLELKKQELELRKRLVDEKDWSCG